VPAAETWLVATQDLVAARAVRESLSNANVTAELKTPDCDGYAWFIDPYPLPTE